MYAGRPPTPYVRATAAKATRPITPIAATAARSRRGENRPAPAGGGAADQGRSGSGAPPATSRPKSPPMIGSSQREVYFEANAPPTARPTRSRRRGDGRSDQSHRA